MLQIRYIALAFAIVTASPSFAASCAADREAVRLSLTGFLSQAEIVRPPRGTAPRALLVLFPGSDVADMDGAIEGAGVIHCLR